MNRVVVILSVFLVLVSVFVKLGKVLNLFKCHWLGDKLNLDFLAFLEHALRSGRSASIDIDFDILILCLIEQRVNGCHEATQQKSWVIQVHKDETVRRVFAYRAAYRVDC